MKSIDNDQVLLLRGTQKRYVENWDANIQAATHHGGLEFSMRLFVPCHGVLLKTQVEKLRIELSNVLWPRTKVFVCNVNTS